MAEVAGSIPVGPTTKFPKLLWSFDNFSVTFFAPTG